MRCQHSGLVRLHNGVIGDNNCNRQEPMLLMIGFGSTHATD
jgi:hypothetical protein